jgi:hypothetical protein
MFNRAKPYLFLKASRRPRQPDCACIVAAGGNERDDRKAVLLGLESEVSPVEMKPERRVESQRRISGNDQQQLVECGDFGGQLGAVEELVAAMDNPAEPVDGEPRRIGMRRATAVARCVGVPRIRTHLSRRTYPVDARDSERTELLCGLSELMKKSPIPPDGKVNILVETHEEFVLRSLDSNIQTGGRAQAALDEYQFV